MKIIFFGTPEYVVPILEALHKKYNRGVERELIGVLTQNPKPSGRDQRIEYSPVDNFAHKHKIDIYFEPEELPDADLAICAAYGRIIPQSVISKFPFGILNIHPSLLPEFRGASPVQATILSGKEQTGLTVIKMDSELDHGPIVSSFKMEVAQNETNEELRDRLFKQSVDFLIELIPNYIAGKITLKPQKEDAATYTKTILKDDALIPPHFVEKALVGQTAQEVWSIRFMKDFSLNPTPQNIERYIRALTSWPGTFTFVTVNGENKRLKILKAHVESERLILGEVQLEGKNPVTFEQFKSGYPSFSFA